MSPSTESRSKMFIDYLSVEQVYPFDLPKVADITISRRCERSGEILSETQPGWTHEGSHSTSIKLRVDGRKLIVQGNPSAIDRLDNLFGYQTIAQCVAVYNPILAEYGLPALTPNTRLDFMQAQATKQVRKWITPGKSQQVIEADREGDAGAWIRTLEDTHKHVQVGDGMRITRVDLTTNRAVGQGNEFQYTRALATQRFGYKPGHLFEDGRTVDWTARDKYAKAYHKGFAIRKFLLPKAIAAYGEASQEVQYLQRLISHCDQHGVVRMELELKREYLLREGLAWWGLFDESRFAAIHDDFLGIDKRLTVTAMDYETISEHLVSQGICPNTKAAMTTASYALLWMTGRADFDFNKRAVQTHRARLRKIGIDIANPCDVTSITPVISTAREVIQTCDVLAIPEWYRRPASHLRLVA